MSSISSVSGINPTAYSRPVVDDSYDTNSKAFGPLVASAIGAAEATGAGASAVVSFSSDSLKKLGDALESGYDAVGDGAAAVASTISDLANQGAQAVEDAYDSTVDAASSAVDSVGDAASAVGDTISSAFSTVGQYAALGMAAGRQLVSEIV